MKKLFIAVFAVIVFADAFAQGVDFRTVTFGEALKMSAAEKKPVFLDCCTSWCAPCKIMAEEVFVLKEAGDYFNAKFVNIKIDMEKGEGVELARQYEVRAYPTFLVLDAEGNELHRVVGGGRLEDFILNVELGIDGGKQPKELEKEYESGTIGKKDLLRYWNILNTTGDDDKADEVGGKLFALLSKSEKLKVEYWPVVSSAMASMNGQAIRFVLDNRKALDRKIGAKKVESLIQITLSQSLYLMLSGTIEPEAFEALHTAVSILEASDIEYKEYFRSMVRVIQVRSTGDIAAYLDVVETEMPNFSNGMEMTLISGANAMLSEETPEGSLRTAGPAVAGARCRNAGRYETLSRSYGQKLRPMEQCRSSLGGVRLVRRCSGAG